MPKLKIGDIEYHLAFRTIIRCQLRTIDAKHAVVAEGEAVCLSTDPFDEKEGKRLAFSKMVRDLPAVGGSDAGSKTKRRKLWAQFLFYLSGKKKPVVKMRKAQGFNLALTQTDPPTGQL